MLDKPFGRRGLLRGAGALTAASLAPWAAAGCAPDDDALTFFFAANPDEFDARMRVVDEFQPPPSRHQGSDRCCPGRASCSSCRRFVPAAGVRMC